MEEKEQRVIPNLKSFRIANARSAVLNVGFNHINWSEALSNGKAIVLKTLSPTVSSINT